MSKPNFLYVTYIDSTPGKVWQALTDGAFTRRCWVNHRNGSDWKMGSSCGTRTSTMRASSTS
jgi:uncharacterized protein YndB with AHSA1/START domain